MTKFIHQAETDHLADIQRRLSSIEGHVRGVARMVEAEESCPAVLLQLSAIQGALTRVRQIIVRDYFENCLAGTLDGELSEELTSTLNELSAILIEAGDG